MHEEIGSADTGILGLRDKPTDRHCNTLYYRRLAVLLTYKNLLEIVHDRRIFLLINSALEGTYTLPPPFFPLFGINSFTQGAGGGGARSLKKIYISSLN